MWVGGGNRVCLNQTFIIRFDTGWCLPAAYDKRPNSVFSARSLRRLDVRYELTFALPAEFGAIYCH